MTAVQIPWAPGAKYIHVTCRIGEPRPDSNDDDPYPDLMPQAGEVTLRCDVSRIRYDEADGRRRMLTMKEWRFSIRATDGELYDPQSGAVGVYVLSGASAGMDPAGFTWTATVTPASGERWSATVPATDGDVFDLVDGADILNPSVGEPTLAARVAVVEAAIRDGGGVPGGGGAPGRGITSVVSDANGLATITYTDGSTSQVQLPRGPAGAASTTPGPPGASAYQIAVNNGFAGSEAEWLESLKGEPGDPGTGQVASVTVTTGTEARPDAPLVFWIGGTVQPANMAVGDVWLAEGTPGPPPPSPVPPVITTASLNPMTVGSVFSQALSASGDAPITWAVTAGTLPAGLDLTEAGLLSGTPTNPGAYDVTIDAANNAGTDEQQYTGTVVEAAAPIPPTITTAALNTMREGSPFSQQLQADGDTPITWAVTAGALPDGLGLAESGSLTGTPTTEGAYDFTVTATNTAGTDTQQYTGTTADETPPGDGISVFGASPPPGTYGVYDDGDGSIRMGTLFYGTQNYRVLGGRVWIPEIPTDPGDLHIWATPAQGGGTYGPVPPAWADMPAQAAGAGTIPVADLVQGWNEIAFPTPINMGPRVTPFETGSAIWIGYHFANGTHYIHTPGSSMPDAQRPAGNTWLTHPEQVPDWGFGGENRRAGSSMSPGGWANATYGIDIIAEAA